MRTSCEEVLTARPSFIHAHVERVRSDINIDVDQPVFCRQIQLTDPGIEPSGVVRLFLILASTLRLPFQSRDFTDLNYIVTWSTTLLNFLRKWGCRSLEELVYKSLRMDVRDERVPSLPLFLTAAAWCSATICEIALLEATYLDDGRGGLYSPFEPTRWPVWAWAHVKRVPPEYVCALVVAWGIVGKHGAKLADEFHRQLQSHLGDARGP